ncbi:MAG: hypothetical protein ACHQXA_01360 [Gemmatimonadales bacterium]
MSQSDEPGYLKAIRAAQQKKKGPAAAPAGGKHASLTPEEREALRWASDVAKMEVTSTPTLSGAGCVYLFSPRTFTGKAPVVLHGVADRAALAQRVAAAASAGETVLGCYDVRERKPLTPRGEGGAIVFDAGPARAVPKAVSPEQMIRKAAAEAAELAKTRKPDDRDRNRGRGR